MPDAWTYWALPSGRRRLSRSSRYLRLSASRSIGGAAGLSGAFMAPPYSVPVPARLGRQVLSSVVALFYRQTVIGVGYWYDGADPGRYRRGGAGRPVAGAALEGAWRGERHRRGALARVRRESHPCRRARARHGRSARGGGC